MVWGPGQLSVIKWTLDSSEQQNLVVTHLYELKKLSNDGGTQDCPPSTQTHFCSFIRLVAVDLQKLKDQRRIRRVRDVQSPGTQRETEDLCYLLFELRQEIMFLHAGNKLIEQIRWENGSGNQNKNSQMERRKFWSAETTTTPLLDLYLAAVFIFM